MTYSRERHLPLTLHVLGRPYLSRAGRPVPMPAKGAALLTYLTLEHRPFHREHLAGLLWTSSDALRNLRVELNRLRHIDPDLLPPRRAMLEVTLPTDLDAWRQQAATLTDAEVGDWLSVGTALPLSGLEDLGSSDLRAWVDAQRWRLLQVVEEQLGATYARFEREGRRAAAALIEARAGPLGLNLQRQPALQAEVHFGTPDLQRPLRRALQAAQRTPQLVLLTGRSAAGRQALVTQVTHGSAWQTLHVQFSPDPDLLHAALLHQLLPLLPPTEQAEARILLTRPDTGARSVIRLWTVAAATGRPLLVFFNDVTDAAPLAPHLQFALNLPVDLTLVVSPADRASARALRGALTTLDGSRLHLVDLPPLGATEIMAALQPRQTTWSDERRYAFATRVAQDADGWEPLARALIDRDADPTAPPGLPDEVRQALLAEVGHLSGPLQTALARLALLHGPVTPALADALLGDDAPSVLGQAEQLGLLVPCEAEETMQLPALTYRPSDRSDTLCFVSELLRAALAGSLERTERAGLRAQLARAVLSSDPSAALHYARDTGEATLIREAQDRLAPPCVHTTAGRPARLLEAAPPVPAGDRRERRTGAGYRVVLEGGTLQVLRRGLYGPPSRLRLPWDGAVRAGPWVMHLRLDTLRAGPDMGSGPGWTGAEVRLGDRAALRLGTTPDCADPPGPERAVYVHVPLGRWVAVRGDSPGGAAELQVQAMDIALTVAHWEVGGETLLPLGSSPAG
ncbi:hypothetical protein LAJ19_18555 (plasmid) [Deinococcus taeanensis]|uniref:hypothetical protein n=1 Tax=Deinococcus taeanensis TaxID=2737050 RepID=UPI001CDD686F|nr:hypothetical protein [Deinococcus taeanensis]UBV45118.1 hypothetical protein LAJ19_18555 [Deinococcus taeanensis]